MITAGRASLSLRGLLRFALAASPRCASRVGLVAGVAVLLAAVAQAAAPPVLEHLYPAGLPRGASRAVVASGRFESWPPHVWVDPPGVEFVAQTNKGTFLVEVAMDAQPGPRLVRLHDPEGASNPRIFVVGDRAEEFDGEPNDHFRTPQVITNAPVTINARLDKNGDVDCFALNLKAGQRLEARADAFMLMSKVDLVFRLTDTNGHQLAWNHDAATLDPQLEWRAARDQTVVLQVFGFRYPADAAIRLTGGEGAVYRLHLDVSSGQGPEGVADAEGTREDAVPEQLNLPASLQGVIASNTEEDRFQFEAAEGEYIEARLQARALGSPLDAWLRIEDTAGAQLAFNDDVARSPDPRLEWKAPTNGVFVVAIGSTVHRGGPGHRYQLEVRKVLPDFEANLATGSLVATSDSTNEVKVVLKRLRGHTNELSLEFENLPQGVSSSPAIASQEAKEVTLPLLVAPDAPPVSQPVRVIARDTVTGEQRAVPFLLTSQGVNNGVPEGYDQLLVESTDKFWLTVKPSPDAAKAVAAKTE